MKISQSLLFAYAAAQGEDRWDSTDYYSFNYGFGGKLDQGLAFGLSENPTQLSQTETNTHSGLQSLYAYNKESAHFKDQLHYNGLLCWMCDFRLDLATEAESTTCDTSGNCNNAYGRCLRGGMLMRCRGEQRTCMFEERRRHGVVYSVCTGCKQTDACVAHWRRNQRFTLPFMNFGDMSLRNLPQRSGNLPIGAASGVAGQDQLPNHRPIYVDDECSTYQETRTESAWRKTVNDPANSVPSTNVGTNNEVYPMGWIPAQVNTDALNGANDWDPYTGVAQVANDGTLDFNPQNSRSSSRGMPFTSDGSTLQFTGHRVNLGLSYSKFAYDGAGDLQLNAQLSQWESTCRWCCHARPDTVCNIEMKNINSSPFATKCGNSVGTRREVNTIVRLNTDPAGGDPGTHKRYMAHPLYAITENFSKAILGTMTTHFEDVTINGTTTKQRRYWQLLDTTTAAVNAVSLTNSDSGSDASYFECSLSNAQWDTLGGQTLTAFYYKNNIDRVPQGIHGKFRFFQPFNIAQSNSDYYNADISTCQNATNLGTVCTLPSDCPTGTCDQTGAYEKGPRFWMQMFQRTPQYDLSHYFSKDQSTYTHARFPSTGEGRNSAGMDKFAGRGNKSRWTIAEETLRDNPELQHFFQQQTDMISQENRDFFDSRARDAKTSLSAQNMYLKNWDNSVYNNWDRK